MRNSLIGGDLLLLLFIGKFQRSCGNFPCQWLCFQLINFQGVRARPQLTPHSLNFHFTTPASFFAQQRWFLSTICIWCLWELIENITHNIVKKSWSTLVQWYHLSPKKKTKLFLSLLSVEFNNQTRNIQAAEGSRRHPDFCTPASERLENVSLLIHRNGKSKGNFWWKLKHEASNL